MILSRRNLVKTLTMIWPGLLWSRGSLAADRRSAFPGRSFSMLIDTFVPADAWQGALDLGIDEQLLEPIFTHPQYQEKVEKALRQLQLLSNQTYGQDFADMNLDDRSRLLETILNKRGSTGELRSQLASLRNKTLTRYYTAPEAFKMLDYHPPSQGGYPDYAKPPA